LMESPLLLIFGLGLLAYSAVAGATGEVWGKIRAYNRREHPGFYRRYLFSYLISSLLMIGLSFLKLDKDENIINTFFSTGVFWLGFLIVPAWCVFVGEAKWGNVFTGKMRVYSRKDQPVDYWLIVVLYVAVSLILFGASYLLYLRRITEGAL